MGAGDFVRPFLYHYQNISIMSLIVQQDCLNDIIGLSRTECECITGQPANDISRSGLWLTEIEGWSLDMTQAGTNCEQGSVWDMLNRARERSISDTKTALASRMSELYKVTRGPFSGIVGEQTHTRTLTVGAYAAQRWCFQNVESGVWVIRRLGLSFNTTANFTIYIYNNIDEDPLHTITATSEAGKCVFRTLDDAITLPLTDSRVPYLEYIFVYATDNGALPYDNKISCGCGGFYPGFSCVSPVFGTKVSDPRNRWHEWCVVTGQTADDVSDFTADVTYNDRCYGLLVDCDIKCNLRDMLCLDLDFDNSQEAMVKAEAVLYRGGELLIEFVLGTGNPNAITLLNQEFSWGKRNHFRKEWQNRIEWLAKHMDIGRSNCLSCDRKMRTIGART